MCSSPRTSRKLPRSTSPGEAAAIMMSGECCRAPLQATGRAGKHSAALALIASALTWCLLGEDGGPSTCCQRRCSSATLAAASSPTPRPLMPADK